MSLFLKIFNKSNYSKHTSLLHTYHSLFLSTSTKQKKLPKKWKPTTTMFVPDKNNPGKYVLSKSNNIKFQYDPIEEGKYQSQSSEDEPSILEQIESAMEEDVDEEESDDLTFLKNYKWIIVSLMSMIIVLMGGFTMGFTRICVEEKSENEKKSKKKKNMFGMDESLIHARHRAIIQILCDLQKYGTDCILIDSLRRFKNKKEREDEYFAKLESASEQESVCINYDEFEQQMYDNVMNTNWPHIDLSEFTVDDILDSHWNLSHYIDDIRTNDIRLQFLPPLDTLRYGEAKKKKLMWIFSKKHLEWFQVVMSFNDSMQRVKDLNFVAIRMRFKEFYCYPLLNEDGTSDTSKWLIEKQKYEPRVEHLRRLHRHKAYYLKKYWHKVEPSKYELDLDDGIIEYYGGKNIFEQDDEEEKIEESDDELIKKVNSLQERLERRARLEQV